MFLSFNVTLSVDYPDSMLSRSLRNGNVLNYSGRLCESVLYVCPHTSKLPRPRYIIVIKLC